ncbi:polysaccharide pyruvyl transferase family protein [Loktanella sp. 3ANDIMAR09]|uniref:polysaccharide pyruvyl transferase family protein n=1 Tax=Loktanella sp. 3ANDIMAR09 TaxID=1225657 RepID=UPI0006F9FB50|nr:polysaccharide pyruvyl transferase family protein [Loktanella sp. 3ANDIMAR09]
MATQKYDVGILGWWYGKNYGSILTYYGLNRAVVGLGYNVLMVHEPLGYNGYRVKWPDDILSMEFARRIGYNYTTQEHFDKLPALNAQAKTFLVGSDQLWNPRIGRVNDDLFLDFVSPENKRVAYGTSFGNRGTGKFTPEFLAKHRPNLQKFAGISVREDYAIDTARDAFGVDAVQVVDPVFLLPQSEYLALAEKATYRPEGDYLAVFFLDATPEKRDVAVALADRLGLKKIVVIPNPDGGRPLAQELFADDRFDIVSEDAPENFLHVYSKAAYVTTDSFHGSAFSVIFQKPFSSIYNTHRGADRFKSLMSLLGFGETRRIYETDTPQTLAENPNVTFDIDFTGANAYIANEGARSLAWLKETLAKDVPVHAGTRQADTARTAAPVHRVDKPDFTASNDAWSVTRGGTATKLSVAPSGAIRGNTVWCDLPHELEDGASYRLTIKWKVRTSGDAVNLHIRNPETGKFTGIGRVGLEGVRIGNRTINVPDIPVGQRTLKIKGVSIGRRIDTVDFSVKQPGFTQFMLGAVHFSGNNGGADVEYITVQEIPSSAVVPAKKGKTFAEVSYDLSIKDNLRFAGAHTKAVAARDIGAWRARLMFHAHAIEKGLSHMQFRPGFGKISVPALAKEMNGWLVAGNDRQDQFFRTAASVMNAYFERHATLDVDVSDFRKQFKPEVQDIIDAATDKQGGVMSARSEREAMVEALEPRNFLDVVYGRRSVREFTDQPVDDADIARAVQIAMQAPSVCNRQSARVHQIKDPRMINDALKLQGGFGGYKMPPQALLITSDLRSFLFAAERNQPFVDGGLFMMTMLLALEQVGLGSCSLNTAMGTEREDKIRKILGIPDHEVFIAFVAVGHYDPEVLVPQSKRIAVDDILIQHGKD